TGMTIFLTTHYMEEASLADNIVVLHEGDIIAEGSPEELKQTYTTDILTIMSGSPQKVETILQGNSYHFKQQGQKFVFYLNNTLEAYPLLQLLEHHMDSFE